RDGDVALCHTSLRSLGWVCGGQVAVVQALLDVLGPEGTLVVPAHSTDNSDPATWHFPPVPQDWWQPIRDHLPGYDPRTTPVRGIGILPETVRTWPGAVRSAHPQVSFAAVGAQAAALLAEHRLDHRFGSRSPLGAMNRAGARILLLGAGYLSCTAFHLAETEVAGIGTETESCAILTDGGRQWVTYTDTVADEEDFADLGAALESQRPELVRRGQVGDAESRLIEMPGAVEFASQWLAAHRRLESNSGG
ncbi:MAG: AAC(3) family N-acetyltransferase, partial [Sporichthyaceae bacterium]|nr:AAC(3) family N-acetyltransferase [Sporichthyaceae bacterium]